MSDQKITGKGLSAYQSRRTENRVPKARLIELPSQYVVHLKTADGNDAQIFSGTFRVVAALCPKIKVSTLKRRLDNGERDLVQLRRAPETKQGARMRRAKLSAAASVRARKLK